MSNKLYTDEELCWATQVAYCNISDADIVKYYEEHKGYPSLQYIFKKYGYGIYYNQDLLTEENTGDKKKMEEGAKEFIDAVIAGEICQGWKVVSVSEQQRENGFYGLTIETSEDNAIVAFRGSESVDANQIIEDWIVADCGIINGTLTEQEKAAGEYLETIGKTFDYENFAVTGHSLGGNLALVSTIYSATTDCKSDVSSRIKQSVSFDGPGHPEEFITTYQIAISEMAGVMTHYQFECTGIYCEKVKKRRVA